MSTKDRNHAMSLVLEVLRGNSNQTAAEIAEETGYSLGAIAAFKKEARGILEAEGVEVAESKRGRKAGSTSAPKAPRAGQLGMKASAVDIEELKAKLRAEIEAELLENRPMTTQDLVKELAEIENEIKTLVERKAVLIRQFDELQADTQKKFELIKAQSILAKGKAESKNAEKQAAG